MGIDVTDELGENRKSDVSGAEYEVLVLVVGVDGAVGGGVEEDLF